MRIPLRLRRKPPLPKRPAVTATPLCPGPAFPFARVFDAVALNARNARKASITLAIALALETALSERVRWRRREAPAHRPADECFATIALATAQDFYAAGAVGGAGRSTACLGCEGTLWAGTWRVTSTPR